MKSWLRDDRVYQAIMNGALWIVVIAALSTSKDTNILKSSLRGAAIVLENTLQGEASPLCHRPRSQVLSITADFDSHKTERPSEFGQCQYSFGDVAVPDLVGGAPVTDLASGNRPVELAKPAVPNEGASAFLKNRKIQFGAIFEAGLPVVDPLDGLLDSGLCPLRPIQHTREFGPARNDGGMHCGCIVSHGNTKIQALSFQTT